MLNELNDGPLVSKVATLNTREIIELIDHEENIRALEQISLNH